MHEMIPNCFQNLNNRKKKRPQSHAVLSGLSLCFASSFRLQPSGNARLDVELSLACFHEGTVAGHHTLEAAQCIIKAFARKSTVNTTKALFKMQSVFR